MTAPQKLPYPQRLLLSMLRKTPLSRGKCRRILLGWLKKRVDYPVISDFRGIPFIFWLDDTSAKMIFGHYDLKELDFLKKRTSFPGAVFVDLGANAGFYTQNFLGWGKERLALAIEPNPDMCARIQENVRLLPAGQQNLLIENSAAGGADSTANLDLSRGFGAASITADMKGNTIPVRIKQLADILAAHSITKIDVMKIDIEGYEDRALIPFFEQADSGLFPKALIIEHSSSSQWGKDLLSVLRDKGYVTVAKTRGNLLMERTKIL